MSFDPARPRHTLPFGGEDHDLLGTLEVIEAVEFAMKEGVIQVAARVVEMGLTDTARLVSAVLTASGRRTTHPEAARVLMDLGVASEAFQAVKLHLYAFLRVALEPPEQREAMAARMGEVLGKWTAPPASPGRRTRKSA